MRWCALTMCGFGFASFQRVRSACPHVLKDTHAHLHTCAHAHMHKHAHARVPPSPATSDHLLLRPIPLPRTTLKGKPVPENPIGPGRVRESLSILPKSQPAVRAKKCYRFLVLRCRLAISSQDTHNSRAIEAQKVRTGPSRLGHPLQKTETPTRLPKAKRACACVCRRVGACVRLYRSPLHVAAEHDNAENMHET